MSGAPARGTVPRRQRRHHHHHHHQRHHQKHPREEEPGEEPEEKRPKVNPIFLWASQREQRIVEVRCEDYDKRNRIKLTKTAQGWRSIPRTASNMYSTVLGAVASQTTAGANSSSSSEASEGKEHVVEPARGSTLNHPRVTAKESPNGRGLAGRESGGRKRNYDEISRTGEHRRDYGFSTRIKGTWEEERRRVPCSDDDDGDNEDEDEDNEEDDADEEENEDDDREDGDEEVHNEEEEDGADENRFKEVSGRSNLEKLQRDKLFQPRVVLEQLHFSQLPASVHRSVLRRRRNDAEGRDGSDVIADWEKKTAGNSEKRHRANKAGIQDILNMIDATASPVLATDTPSADLPVDSTYKINGASLESKSIEGKIKDSNSTVLTDLPTTREQPRTSVVECYETENDVRNDAGLDDKLEIHEEKIVGIDALDEGRPRAEENVVVVSLQSNSDPRSCKIAEADGGVGSRGKSRPNGHSKWQNTVITSDSLMDTEEERPDEPGEPPRIDYSDSSKILNALRNTPGLSVSITRTQTPESTKSAAVVPLARPSSKASSSSRSPDSQAECVERLCKNADSATETRVATASPKNLPGLSIIIPSYRYRNSHLAAAPSTKARVESPESTVNFSKNDAYAVDSKLDGFPHEEDEDDRDNEEDEDDCDSQVLEDLRRQKADSLACDADGDYFSRRNVGSQEDRKTPLETTARGQAHWITSSRSSEAQAKCKYQDVEHFDEHVLEELRTRGTVVSPQPSGIPCSPASRRPSSAYLERLLPSPPCSVSCSEDAKNDLTLKGILASPSRLETRDYERQKDTLIRSDQTTIDHLPARPDYAKDVEKSAVRKGSRNFQERFYVPNHEARTPGRPMSSGDIHSTYFYVDRATPKRPMSAEWSVSRQKSHSSNSYQRSSGKVRVHPTEEGCATSSTTDKLLDPASQLRELIELSGHLIPDPLLVPRDCLPGLAAAPATEIPKLLASRPELRLPEALTRPDLLRDPDLLVISLAHLQHVLDHGEGPVARSRQSHPRVTGNNNGTNKGSGHASNGTRNSNVSQTRPKLSCKPIGTLMPAPIDLSSNRRASPYPPLLRVRSGLLKQEPEVSSTASSPDDSQLWHPLFGSQKRQQQQHQQQGQHQQHHHQHQHHHASWHRTTLAS